MAIWINGIDVSKPPFTVSSNLFDILRMREEMVDLPKIEQLKPWLRCVHCGKDIKMVGPETFHVESTLIRCDRPGVDGVEYKATAFTEEAWRDFRDYWLNVGEGKI